MAELLVSIAILALGVAISPVPLGAVIMLLGTRRPAPNAAAFLAGWALAICAVGAVTATVVSGTSEAGDVVVADAVGLAVGGVLLALGIVQLGLRLTSRDRIREKTPRIW